MWYLWLYYQGSGVWLVLTTCSGIRSTRELPGLRFLESCLVASEASFSPSLGNITHGCSVKMPHAVSAHRVLLCGPKYEKGFPKSP